jgi:hypothetical protein
MLFGNAKPEGQECFKVGKGCTRKEKLKMDTSGKGVTQLKEGIG